MAVDLKLDIIYYNTPTDFEMEFSLSSRCVMRMLTSKSNTAKDFLNDLSRAVSRSRVILCVGNIYDDNSVIDVTSQAVGLKLCTYDADAYSVTDTASREVLLPDGALPLVSEDGTLGGCLIESGPQIIIFLSDDKPLRKRILRELVFEYITALSGADINQATIDQQNDSLSQTEKSDDIENLESEKVHEVSDNDNEQENEPDPEQDFVDQTEQRYEDKRHEDDHNDSNIIISSSENTEQNNAESEDYGITNDLSEEIELDFQNIDSNKKKATRFLGLKITIGVLCLILAAITGALIYYYIG